MAATSKKSAGILLYRFSDNIPEVFLVHPGGPFWKKKDTGAWSIPKGEFSEQEDPLGAAKREFLEETGTSVNGDFIPLKPVKLKSGKMVYAWAVKGDPGITIIKSNFFEIEWPPRSGKKVQFPEIDKGEWFDLVMARQKMNPSQAGFIDELETIIKEGK